MKTITAALSAAFVLALAGPALAQDTDGDGAADSIDGFPCNAGLAGQVFAPAQDASALLIFEDQWPNWGDLDTNDVVIAYNVVQDVDGAGQVVHLQMTLDVLALGGVFDNGLGLRLPVAASNVSGVTLSIDGGTPMALTPSATDTNLTVVLQNNLRALFGGQAGQINSRSDLAVQAGLSMLVDVTFTNPVSLSAALAPFDTYVFRSNNTSHEIHRSMYAGTSQMDTALFGTLGDNSGNGRYFVDIDGIPAAIVLPETAPYPREAVRISTLFPNIIPWAQSGGTTNQDFYSSNVVTSAQYADVNGSGAPVATRPAPLHADTTCTYSTGADPANAAESCLAILNAGASTGDGGYWLDPNGGSTADAFLGQCDMSQDGGGWTKLGAGLWYQGVNDALPTNSMLSAGHITDLLAVSSDLFRIGTSGVRMYIHDSGVLLEPSYHYWRSVAGPLSCALSYDSAFPSNMTAITNPRQVNCDPIGIGSHSCGSANGWALWHIGDAFNISGAHPCSLGTAYYPTGGALRDLWVR